jgi:hypothetical protein
MKGGNNLKLLKAVKTSSGKLKLSQPFMAEGKRWCLLPNGLLFDPSWYPLPTESPGNTILSSRWNNILTSIQDTTDGHSHEATDSKALAAAAVASGVFPIARGGTGLSTIAAGGILYASALDTLSRIAPTAANQILRSTGANALEIAAMADGDLPAEVLWTDLARTVTALLTFDRDPSAPFAVSAGSAKVANLDGDKVDGVDLPAAIASVLTDHTKAVHDALAINADKVDGYDATNVAGQIPVYDANTRVIDSDKVDGYHRAVTSGQLVTSVSMASNVHIGAIACGLPSGTGYFTTNATGSVVGGVTVTSSYNFWRD